MRYLWRWLALFVCVFAVAVIFLWNSSVIQSPGQAVSNSEPSYDGKPTSYWTARMHEYIENTECWAIEPGAKRYRHNLGEVKFWSYFYITIPKKLAVQEESPPACITKDPLAFSVLVHLTADSNKETRRTAIDALRWHADGPQKAAVERIFERIADNDPDWYIRLCAKGYLEKLRENSSQGNN